MTFNFTVKEFILGGGTGTPTFQFYKRGFELGVSGGQPGPSWQDIILSGVGSLTLTNAKKNSISYLKLFGGLEQRNLPKEYTQLDYAVIPADSYVKCLTQPVSGGRVELDFQTTSLYSSALRNYYGGRYDGATAGAGIRLCRVATSKRIVMYGFDTSTGGQATGDYVFEGNTRYQYVYDNGTSTLSTGGSVVETKTSTINDTTTSDVAVNSYRQNDGTYSTATERIYVYSYKNFDANGALLENWIPVQKENTVYFYDTVSGTELSVATGSASSLEAGTAAVPSPDTPMNIVCNNGTLTVVDDELPSGYKRVKDITMNNNCYYTITDFKLRGSDTIRFAFSVTVSGTNVLGCYTSSSAQDNYSLYVGSANSAAYLRYNGGAYNSTASPTNLRYDVVISPTGSTGMLFPSTWEEKEFETPVDLCIGTTSVNATSSKLIGTLYGNIVVDGRLKLIPCERVSDGYLGYYDTYTQTFYEKVWGTEPTTSGYDSSHYVLAVDGTKETVGVKDQYNRLPVNAQPDVLYPITVTDSGNWTASANVNSGQNLLACEIRYYNSNKEQINYYTMNGYSDGRMYKVFPATTAVKYVSISRKSAYAATPVTELKVEMGGEMTPYYSGGTATATDLLAVGDYKDVQEVISGNVTRNTAVLVLTGTEAWGAGSSGTGYRKMSLPLTNVGATGTNSKGLCTHYKCEYANTVGNFYFSSDGTLQMVVDSTETLSGFKKGLAQQYANGTPVIVIYPLATATTESVAGQTLHNQAGTNTIEITQASIDNLPLEVKYKGTEEEEVEGE